MERLPTTIIEQIVLEAADFGPHPEYEYQASTLAATCPFFQHVIEKRTFRTLRLTAACVPAAMSILGRCPDRINHVEFVDFVAVLPEYDEDACCSLESPAERAANSRKFSRDVGALFGLLSSWVGKRNATHGVQLAITAWSPTDSVDDGTSPDGLVRPTFDHPTVLGDLHDGRFSDSGLDLSPSDAPSRGLDFITGLSLEAFNRRYISDKSIGLIGSDLSPNLWSASLGVWDWELGYEDIRRMRRRELAASIAAFPKSLRRLSLASAYVPPADQSSRPTATVAAGESEDRLTAALRQISQQLEHLELREVLCSPQLFMPKDSPTATAPYWPELRFCSISYHIVTPEGEWVFEGSRCGDHRRTGYSIQYQPGIAHNPGMENRDFEQFRYTPREQPLDRFHLAAARAAARMPRLEQMTLQSLNFTREDMGPSGMRMDFRVEGRIAALRWTGSPHYIPDYEVLAAWGAAAEARDAELVVEYCREPLGDVWTMTEGAGDTEDENMEDEALEGDLMEDGTMEDQTMED
ncbi:hypothetical protein GGR56DRAFT_673815 [Xylariaceae sp. FL0804]|nr:hypothetical protein GGR56DRAFT_673815 [Xylariaceae sp. FL0804]